MKNYVECQHCKWQLEQQSERDWASTPCRSCHNTRKVIDPKEILCNLCGETMCPFGTMNEQIPHGLHEAHVTGGYDSYHLFDLSRYTFSFCEKCLRQLFIQCKIKPIIHVVNVSDEFTAEEKWEEDQEYYEYKVWKDAGNFHQAYVNGKCNMVKDCPNKAIYTRLHNDTEFTEYALCEDHKYKYSYSNSKLTKFIPNILKPFL